MNFVILCPICATKYTNRQDSCSNCGSSKGAIFVHPSLVKVVTLLIKLGVGVVDTGIKHCTTHQNKISIYLSGSVPEYLFTDLPSVWRIKDSNKLYCSDIDRIKVIKELEEWAMDKDPDGFKALLRLSGYDIGQ